MSVPTDGHFIYEDISPDVGSDVYIPRLQQIVRAGFSQVLNYSLLNTNTAGMIGYINTAASLGLKVIIAVQTEQYWKWGHINWYPQLYADAGNPGTLQAMIGYIVNQTKNLPGTYGWYVADEPGTGDAAALLTWCTYIRNADTTGKPRVLVEAWDDNTKNFAGGTSPWNSTYCEIGLDDFYPLGDTREVWHSTATQAANIQTTCTARGIGSGMVLQSFGQTRYNLQRVTPFPAGAPYPTLLQMQQQKDACLRNMTPRLIGWYSYHDTNIDWTDGFDTDTSGFAGSGVLIYTQSHNNSGSNATWTWDTADSRLVQSGGVEGVLIVSAITVTNGYVESVMAESDASAGLCARWVDGNNTYLLSLKDGSNGSGPNTFNLTKIVGGSSTGLASGSLPSTWTRGVQHTFRLQTIESTICATMDGISMASISDTSITGPAKFGLLGGANAQFYSMSVIPQGADSSSTRLTHLTNVVTSGLSLSLVDEAISAQTPLSFYKLEDTTGFFAADSGSAHADGVYHNDGLGASGSLTDVILGQSTLTPLDQALSASFGGASGYVELATAGLPTGAQPWTLFAVVSMPVVQSGYKSILNMGQASLYYTDHYHAGGELIVSVGGVTDLEPTSPAFTAGAIYHVGATYDGSVLKLYINGDIASQQTIGAINQTYGYARIAADGSGSYNHCSVSKAVIDNKVWTAATFAHLYRTLIDSRYAVYQLYQSGVIPGIPAQLSGGNEVLVDLSTETILTTFPGNGNILGPYSPPLDGKGDWHHGSS